MPRCLPTAVALILALAPTAAVGADFIAGPINARVVSAMIAIVVYAYVRFWLGMKAGIAVLL